MRVLKPWEEEWKIEWAKDLDGERVIARITAKRPKNAAWDFPETVLETDHGVYGPTPERAKLIEQAPVMARLLLKLADVNSTEIWLGGENVSDSIHGVLKAAGVIK